MFPPWLCFLTPKIYDVLVLFEDCFYTQKTKTKKQMTSNLICITWRKTPQPSGISEVRNVEIFIVFMA